MKKVTVHTTETKNQNTTGNYSPKDGNIEKNDNSWKCTIHNELRISGKYEQANHRH